MPKPKPATKDPKPTIIVETDLRSITRKANRLRAVVRIQLDWETRIDWLLLGETQIVAQKDGGGDGRWRLESHLAEGVADIEHDTGFAVRLPLIGLQLGPLAVYYHHTHLFAWVDPNAEGIRTPEFHVPRPGYDPVKHPDTFMCDGIYDEKKKKYCKWNEGKPHPIIPQGFYVPPYDAELYEAVKGKKVEITIGPAHTKEDE